MKVLIADDHPLTLQGTVAYVESLGHTVIHACSNGTAAWNAVQIQKPDVVVLDLNMPGLDGLEVAQKIIDYRLRIHVIVLTMHNEISLLRKAKELGIQGYILKEKAFPDLAHCFEALAKQQPYFSPALDVNYRIDSAHEMDPLNAFTLSEKKIVELIARQKTSKQIAELLFLSEKTVEGHRTRIIEKLGLPKEKNALLIWAIQNVRV